MKKAYSINIDLESKQVEFIIQFYQSYGRNIAIEELRDALSEGLDDWLEKAEEDFLNEILDDAEVEHEDH